VARGRKIFSLFGSIAIEGMGKTKKDLTEVELKARAFNKRMNRLGRDMNKAGKAITKNLTLPLIAAAAAAVKFGADFDQAMTNSMAIMSDLGNVTREELEGVARDVAKTTKFSATQAAEAYYFLASAGLTAAESMEALPKVAAFAQAGNFDLATATDLLTDAQSALGLSTGSVEERMQKMVRVSDVLTKAQSIANATSQQFAESLQNKAGAALKFLNKDVEEGAAVLAVFADQSKKGVEAGTMLDIVLRDLQTAAVKNGKAFKDAGVEVFDSDENMRNMADIVEDLENRLGGMSDKQKQSELMMLGFTSKSVAATKALIGTSDAIREYEETLRGAAGITEEVAKKQMQTFWAQLGLLKDKAIDLGITLSKALTPILEKYLIPLFEKLIKTVEGVLAWFGEHKIIAQFAGVFVTVLAAAGPVLLLFVKLVPLIKGLYLGFKVLTGAQLALNASMAANPIGLIVIGIAALTAGIVVLVKNLGTVKKMWFSVWDGIKFHFANVASAIAIGYSKMIVGILKGVQKVGKFIPGMSKGLRGLIKTYEMSIKTLETATAARKASNAMTEEEVKLVKEAEKAVEAKAKTEEKAAEQKKVLTLEEQEKTKKLAEDKAKFEADWTEKNAALSRDRLQTIEAERSVAIAEAEKLGADKANINAFYNAKIAKEKLDIEKDASDEAIRIARKEAAEKKKAFDAIADFISTGINGINKIWQASLNKRNAEIDEETENRRKAVEHSTMSEEAKAEAIEKIDTEAAAKKLELQKENAKREKAAALFGIALSTAIAVASALPNIPLSITVGVLGAVQLGIAAATPTPFEEGGLVKSSKGRGVFAQIGEGDQDELVLPMKTGAAELANNIIGKISEAGASVAGIATGKSIEKHTHLHIGTLIADDFGLKKLSKMLNKYTVAENQRTGV
jgi:TP901 family phage tail tape measure protein